MAVRTRSGRAARREGFASSWRVPGSESGGRRTVWIHPGVPVEFHFAEDAPVIDRAWADALMRTADTAAGLHLVPESGAGAPGAGAPGE
ncbi:ATP-dependent DNA ligase [Clavibacter michiganensis]|uniref:ATP-dependent DNA ligase n=1 Tax=Clavibacter michiganensis TaxID=28447 RepID=A0A2S5VS74_9MICO|nr:ATP-dependent DNA ligase [Clavibacter michiganensis]